MIRISLRWSIQRLVLCKKKFLTYLCQRLLRGRYSNFNFYYITLRDILTLIMQSDTTKTIAITLKIVTLVKITLDELYMVRI